VLLIGSEKKSKGRENEEIMKLSETSDPQTKSKACLNVCGEKVGIHSTSLLSPPEVHHSRTLTASLSNPSLSSWSLERVLFLDNLIT